MRPDTQHNKATREKNKENQACSKEGNWQAIFRGGSIVQLFKKPKEAK